MPDLPGFRGGQVADSDAVAAAAFGGLGHGKVDGGKLVARDAVVGGVVIGIVQDVHALHQPDRDEQTGQAAADANRCCILPAPQPPCHDKAVQGAKGGGGTPYRPVGGKVGSTN